MDVMVIGAGPAGCTAAKILAERGYRVLLVEKFSMPRYKSCSGVLIKKSMNRIQRYFGECVPESVTCSPAENRGMIFTDDRGNEFRFAQPGLNVWRSALDHWLMQKAADSGAAVRDNTAAVSCEESGDRVTVTLCSCGKRCTETVGWVLDCEGVVGTIRRKLRGQNFPYILTYQTFNTGTIALDPHYFYAYLQPELSEYDAWFNVKDDQIVLGVSVKNHRKVQTYYENFIAYMTRQHGLCLTAQHRGERWLMPHIRPGCPIDFGVGRVLFAGEAAGFLNPMGEGISVGIESACSAACALAEHFEDPAAVYAAYRLKTAELHRYMKRQWSFVGGMAAAFSEMKSGADLY